MIGYALGDKSARQMNPKGVHSAHHPQRGDLSARTEIFLLLMRVGICRSVSDLFSTPKNKIIAIGERSKKHCNGPKNA